MAGLSKVIVLDPDPRAGRQIQFGFGREGIAAILVAPPAAGKSVDLPADAAVGLIVVGGGTEALPWLTAIRAARRELPILYTGTASGDAARAAGADEAVPMPGTFLRDVVTIGRLLGASAPEKRNHIVGQLSELTNVFSLVRALAVIGRSATLMLMRGLRRGEVRFFHGEVTSCELGLVHGQAAFHQLLLWTEARFDFRHEDIVRRQQIPLSHDELLVDAEHFLAGIRESSGFLSPSMVLEQDIQRVHGLGKQIPTEVHGVLRMFDGHRVLADVLEDSPYRVFETLRVAQRAVEAGLLRVVQGQRPKATWRAVLAIEEWLVGGTQGDGVVDRATDLETEPISGPAPGGEKLSRKTRRNRKQRRANTPLPTAAQPPINTATIDWGALVPRAIGADIGTLSQIVPAAHTSGEISLPPSRQIERERLEALMDTGKRDKIFPSEVTSGPSVVLDEGSRPHPAPPPEPTEELPPVVAPPRTVSAEFRDGAQEQVRQLVKVQQTERMIADADARRALEARSVQASDTRTQLEQEIRAREAAESAAAAEATARRVETQIKAANEAAAKALSEAMKGTVQKAREREERETREREERKEREAREAREAGEARARAEAEAEAARARAAEADAVANTVASKPAFDANGKASELVAALVSEVKTDVVTVAETGTATVTVQDTVRIGGTTSTAEIHAIPVATIKESSHPLAAIPIADQPTAPLKPSNGEVTERSATAETQPIRPNKITGEIVTRRKSESKITKPPAIVTEAPAVVAHDASALAAAATKASEKQPERRRATTKTPVAARTKSHQNIATPARDKAVSDLRKDAVAFSDDEEAFFRGGDDKHAPVVEAPPVETFEDLDEGYQRVGFWDRLIGRKPKAAKPTKKK